MSTSQSMIIGLRYLPEAEGHDKEFATFYSPIILKKARKVAVVSRQLLARFERSTLGCELMALSPPVKCSKLFITH
jgi:hypothetical protein